MNSSTLQVSHHGQVLEVALDRPERLNALSRQLLDDLRDALAAVRDDDTVSVILLKATGQVFTVGYDVTPSGWLFDEYPADMDSVDAISDHEDVRSLLAYFVDLWKYPKPIVAQVQGMCLSGGNELLAACDLVVASEQASFGHPAGRDLGIPPTVFNWPLLVGMRQAREMLYTSKPITAEEAHRLGMVNRVVAPDDLDRVTRELCDDVARTPIGHLQVLKRSVSVFYENMGMLDSWDTGAALDAIFHQSDTYLDFFKKVASDGLGAALAERTERYEYPT